MKNKKLYRALSKDNFHFDIIAKNKEQVKKAITFKGFDLKNWIIERIR